MWHEYIVRADSLYYLREKLRVTNPFFDEVAGDHFYSFVLECWERRVVSCRDGQW
jgi:hypothetical protein